MRVWIAALLDMQHSASVSLACAGQTVAARKAGVYRLECGPEGPGLLKKRRARDAFDAWSAEPSERARKMMGWKQPSTVHDPTFTDPEDIRRWIERQ